MFERRAVQSLLRPAVVSAMILVIAPAGSTAAGSSAEDAYREGRLAAREGRHAAAIEAFERAVALEPRHVDAWLQLGVAHSRQGDWLDAASAYETLLEIDPRHARAMHNLGNVHYRRGQLERAAQAYGDALAADPDYLLAAYHQGWMLRQLGRSEEAERSLGRCLTLPATSDRDRRTQLDCLFYLGTLRHRAGDYAEAASTMERVLQAVPEHAEARHYLGLAYRRLGRTDDARRELERHRQMLRSRRGPPIARDDIP